MFWQRIRQLLDRRGLSDAWLIKQSGVARSSFNRRSKNGKLPYLDEAMSMAAALDTTVEYLMTGEEFDPYAQLDPLSRQVCEALMELSDKDKGKVLTAANNLLSAQETDETEKEARDGSNV